MAALVFRPSHESDDHSSIISTSSHLGPSDSDTDQAIDNQKYRLPEVGPKEKSRGSSRNGFILEDGRVAERGSVIPPPPPPKDTPPYTKNANSSGFFNPNGNGHGHSDSEANIDSYFNPMGMHRAGSVYTLSRASFTNQLSQLTSIRLPQPNALASSIKSIPTANAAVKALVDTGDQIRMWISKASEVLGGLDAEDDVEWAADGGREGLGDVDAAVDRFETLIEVYVGAIEDLEQRQDITSLTKQDHKVVIDRMEKIVADWEGIRRTLQGVKTQVEMAMEWEELWNKVLGEIGMEVDNLNRMIFEMEEKRHQNSLLDAMAEPGHGLDIKELETIVEEAPARSGQPVVTKNRLSILPAFPSADSSPAQQQKQPSQEDTNLLGLFARMQPLRAALDFLPMRFATFFDRSKDIFPTACDELERRQEFLEGKYKKLEGDAESLRKELGEDRWVLIFRKAGSKALKMCESVERSIAKLREALEEGTQHTNPPALAKRIESYEAKKEHYGPAIQQVLAIIDRGVQTRLTVNGEILRLQTDMQRRWGVVEALIKGMDFALEQLNIGKTHQLRDSVSTIVSEQRSIASSSAGTNPLLDTPASSPASSVVLLSRQSSEQGGPSSASRSKSRTGSFASSTTLQAPRPSLGTSTPSGKRYTSLPSSIPGPTRKTPLSKASSSDLRKPVTGVSSRLYTPPPPRPISRSVSRAEDHIDPSKLSRPRWNGSTNLRDTALGHNFKPLTLTTPSPYRKLTGQPALRSPRSFSIPSTAYSSGVPSPLGRAFSTGLAPSPTTTSNNSTAVSRNPTRPSSTVPPITPASKQPVSKIPTGGSTARPRVPKPSTTTSASSHLPTSSSSTTSPKSALPRAASYATTVGGASPGTASATPSPASSTTTPRSSLNSAAAAAGSPSARAISRPGRPSTAMGAARRGSGLVGGSAGGGAGAGGWKGAGQADRAAQVAMSGSGSGGRESRAGLGAGSGRVSSLGAGDGSLKARWR